MTDPDRIRQEIEETQGRLSSDVDALAEKVTPSRIVERRVGRVRDAAGRWKDTVMGSDPQGGHGTSGTYLGGGPGPSGHAQNAAGTVQDAAHQAGGVVQHVGEQASGLVSDAAGAVAHAPQAVRRQAQGNPLAAGLVAFGAGWLVASLLPASRRERELAEQAQELAQPLADKAREVVSDLQQPAQQAVQQVRETAQDAAQTVAQSGRAAAGQVQERAQEAPQNVKENVR